MTDIRKTTRFSLGTPITVEGREVTELNLRRIKGKDIRDMDRISGELDQTAYLITTLSGMPPEAFDEMDAEDIEKVSKVIEGFMGRKARR